MSVLSTVARWLRRRMSKPRSSDEAREATGRATQDLREIQERWPRVRRTVDYILGEGQRNHFSDEMTRLFRE